MKNSTDIKRTKFIAMKKIVSQLLFLTALPLFSLAQQEVMISQYMFNGLFLNPAYTGSHKYFSATLLHRNQWLNLEGAPKSYLFAVDGPVKGKNMGIGLSVVSDKIGITNQTDVMVNYSYHLQVTDKSRLSFGLKGGIANFKSDFTELTYWDDDNIYNQGTQQITLPKFGFGMYYYSENYYAGFSIPTLLAYEKNHKFSFDVSKSSDLARHYMVYGGIVKELNEYFHFKPSVLLKYLPNAPMQADINASLLYKEMFWFGVSYRTGESFVGIIEYQTNQRFRIGYAYDFNTSGLKNYNSGSHEIMLGYDFGKDFIAVKTPRFF